MSTQDAASGRDYGGISVEVRKAERRQRIIQAAISVYAEVGYHRATVREICKQAGLTARYFYESFEDGEALFEACYEHVLEVFISKAVAAAIDFSDDRHAQIRTFQRTYFNELKERPVFAQVFLMDLASVSPHVHKRFSRSVDMIAGQFPGHMPIDHDDEGVCDIVRRALAGGVVHIAKRWVDEDFATPIDTLLEATRVLYGLSESGV
ncbi:MAG: TetR/AcrR family transcriptional regulator [Pseudomonadota bacterium]